MAGGFIGRLRTLLGSSLPSGKAAGERVLFIEEDLWGETEVLPAANADWCRTEFAKIARFADAHQAPGGAGWTDIYMRPPPPVPLIGLHIPLAPALQSLGQRLSAFDRVTSGSFYAPEEVVGARAFGPSPSAAVNVLPDAAGRYVREMILVLAGEGNEALAVMAALRSLPSRDGLIVVDWVGGRLVQL